MNGKQIRLSGETLEKLKTIGKPFESVDDCLQRILEQSCIKNENQKPEINQTEPEQ